MAERIFIEFEMGNSIKPGQHIQILVTAGQ
jgi:hypothetical protein